MEEVCRESLNVKANIFPLKIVFPNNNDVVLLFKNLAFRNTIIPSRQILSIVFYQDNYIDLSQLLILYLERKMILLKIKILA